MERFAYNFTDLTTFETPCQEVWINSADLHAFAKQIAREMRNALPDLAEKGVCVGVYDRQGEAISYTPLDTLH